MHPPLNSFHARTFGAVLVCCLALAACRSPEERFAAHVARAEEFVAEGRTDEAILEYRSSLNIDATSAEVNHRIAELMRSQGAVDGAAQFFLEAYRLDPSRIDAAMRYAKLVAKTSRRRADELVAEALERAADQAIVHRTVALLAVIDGDTDKALEAAQKAIDLDGQDSESWIQLGRVHASRVEAAVISKQPISESVYRDAIAAFDRATELRGGDVVIQLERAAILGAWKPRSVEVRRAYEETLEFAAKRRGKDEQALAANALAQYSKAVGDPESQARALRAFVAIYPDSIGHWRELAEIEGEAVYAELLEARSDDPRAHGLYANYLAENGREDEAAAHLDEVLSRGLESPVLWDDLIRRRLHRAQLKQALDALENLEDQHPDHPLTRRAQARVAMAKGENAEAVKQLRLIPNDAITSEDVRLLALAEYRRGNLDGAKQAIARSLSLSSDVSYSALRLKARIHHHLEEWPLAFKAYSQILDAGIELSPDEQLMAARTLYESRRRAAGRARLLVLLGTDDVPPRAAVEYAQREGKRDPVGAMLYLRRAYPSTTDNFAILRAMTTIDRRTKEGKAGLSQALNRVDAAVEKGEGGVMTLLLRAEILTDLGELDRAENDALRAFEAAPSMPGAVDLLTQIYRKQGKLAEAQKSFEEADQAGVLHAGARRLLARLYAEQGNTADAIRMLEKVLGENPDMVGAERDLAQLLAEGGSDLERALELARKASKRQTENPRSASTLAFACFRNELNEEALQQYRRAIKLDRVTGERMAPSLLYHLGLTLQKLDQNARAAKAFESALAYSSDFPEAADARRQLDNASSG